MTHLSTNKFSKRRLDDCSVSSWNEDSIKAAHLTASPQADRPPDIMVSKWNNNSAIKRIMQEWRELQNEPSSEFIATPLDDNLFEWHFTVRGPQGTSFEGGKYHGRIILPSEYPFKPPNIIFLTPNGRFELHKKICLTITNYHPEFWQPAWGIRTALLALISYFPVSGEGSVGSLQMNDADRRFFAKKSLSWACELCGLKLSDVLNGPNSSVQPPPIPISFHVEKQSKTVPEQETSQKDGSSERGESTRVNSSENRQDHRQSNKSYNSTDLILALVLSCLVVLLSRKIFF